MNKEKIVVIILLITIILSIGSIVITFSLNSDSFSKLNVNKVISSTNAGSVNLVITEQPTGGGSP